MTIELIPGASERIENNIKKLRAKDITITTATVAAWAREIMDTIEQEMDERRLLSFQGPYDAGKSYRRGSLVQKSGGLYVALCKSNEAPGNSSHWRKL